MSDDLEAGQRERARVAAWGERWLRSGGGDVVEHCKRIAAAERALSETVKAPGRKPKYSVAGQLQSLAGHGWTVFDEGERFVMCERSILWRKFVLRVDVLTERTWVVCEGREVGVEASPLLGEALAGSLASDGGGSR